jgi:hypothetical protein
VGIVYILHIGMPDTFAFCCPKVLNRHDTEADEVTIRDADTGEVEEDHGGIRLS